MKRILFLSTPGCSCGFGRLVLGAASSTAGAGGPAAAAIRRCLGEENLCDGPEACRRAVRAQVRRGVDVIKIMTTGGVNSRIGAGLNKQMFEDEARALIETAHLYGKKVAVHAHGADGVKLALKFGADSIEHGTLIDEEAVELFVKTAAYYVPTLSTVNGYLERLAKDPNAYPPAVRVQSDWAYKWGLHGHIGTSRSAVFVFVAARVSGIA